MVKFLFVRALGVYAILVAALVAFVWFTRERVISFELDCLELDNWKNKGRVWFYSEFLGAADKAGIPVRLSQSIFRVEMGMNNEFVGVELFGEDAEQGSLAVKEIFISYFGGESGWERIVPTRQTYGLHGERVVWYFPTERLLEMGNAPAVFFVNFGRKLRYVEPTMPARARLNLV